MFEREKVEFNKDGTMKKPEKEKKDEEEHFTDIRGNCSVEKVSLTQGAMPSVKPLV